MRVSVRATVAVAMLVAFYLLAVGLILGLLAAEVFVVFHTAALAWITVGVVVLPAALALCAALAAVERGVDEQLVGVPTTESRQPELWALAAKIAHAVGTRVPDEIRIVDSAEICVSDTTSLLGLWVRRRRLYLGAPMLAGLTEQQVGADIAIALARSRARGTRLAGTALAGRVALRRAHEAMEADRALKRLIRGALGGYASAFRHLTDPISRHQWLRADAAAARVVGSAVTESALRESAVVGVLWHRFVEDHLRDAWDAGYLPERVFDGFAEMRRAPELYVVLEHLRGQVTEDETADPHCPTAAVRVAAIREIAAPDDGVDRPAVDLVRDPVRTLDRAVMLAMVESADEKKRVDWPTLWHVGVRHRVREGTVRLLRAGAKATGQRASLGAVLDALDADRLVALAPTDEGPGGADAGPRARREFARDVVGRELAHLVMLAYVDAGHGRWTRNWAGQTTLATKRDDMIGLPGLAGVAVSDGGTTGLRESLAAAGVAVDFRPSRALPRTPR
ncbi:M48 family metallopeptidase [Actinokineospora enzanensis]|uniref:M48 family metallopeptidase n=1 Tax=Actinokineospora enzanensis TaxID=155975 RepID=UPI00036AEAFE|nr:M48 family metallopeptidase [Actinokineospora enzanensis]